ncbi:G-protein coupled receptor 54-like [Diadema antillarum]|uniref:G-protein coupled receptor 54-like n=1 Tax=Diadema antillarum TaxID=105358 RepID=UPI003A89F77B
MTTSKSSSLETDIFIYGFCLLFGAVGIMGNGLVLFVIAMVDDLRDVANLFIANQSLVDMMTSVLLIGSYVIPLPAMPRDSPLLARFICAFWNTRFLFWSLIVASSLNLVLMTLERYYAIMYPIQYRSQINSHRAKVIAPIPWIIGFLYQQNLLWFTSVEDDMCLLFQFPSRLHLVSLGLLGVFLEFILPVIVVMYVHVGIVRKLRKSVVKRAEGATHDRNKSNFTALERTTADAKTRARKNVIKTLFFISIFFVICWTPNQVIYMYYSILDKNFADLLLYKLSVFLAFGNMCINPFIYTFQYRRFRKVAN